MRFTLRQLEYFIAAGETGSITRASERLNISQPSISTAISQLEKVLGVQLFIRHHAQGLSLTPVGRTLLAEARQLIVQAGALHATASEASETVSGTLNAGCLTTLAPMILPELAHGFTAAFPKARVRPEVAHQELIFERLRHAAIDVAITYDLAIPEDIDFVPLVALPVHAVVAETHPLARHSSVTLRELAGLPMVFLDLPLSGEYFLSLFRSEGLEPEIAYRFAHPDVIRTMVANGYGYTLANVTPRADLALDGRKVVRLGISGQHAPMTIGLASLKALRQPRLVEAFKAHARSFISPAYVPGMVAPALG